MTKPIEASLGWLRARRSRGERDELGYEQMIMPALMVIAVVCLVLTVYRLLF